MREGNRGLRQVNERPVPSTSQAVLEKPNVIVMVSLTGAAAQR
jgi:hypothetical protein